MTSRLGSDKRRDGRPRESREHKGSSPRFHDYTPLTVSREKILTECANSEFKQANVRFPKQLPTRSNTDKTKYCRFHKSHGHNTDDCIHLKDAIEILIRDGHLKQFTKNKEAPRQEVQESKKIEEETPSSDNTGLQVALSITRPEDFYVPEEPEVPLYFATHSPWENFPSTLVIQGEVSTWSP